MHLKQLMVGITFLLAYICTLAQNKPDTAVIKNALMDTSSSEGYKALLGRFNTRPRYLYAYEVSIIYYATLFQKERDQTETQKKINELILEKRFNDVIVIGEPLLKTSPTNLQLLIALKRAYDETKQEIATQITNDKLILLRNAITMNGEGKTEATTLKVANVQDEDALMEMIGIKSISRKSEASISSNINQWIVTTELLNDWGYWAIPPTKESKEYKKYDVFIEIIKPR